jgi:hypothetical protein
VRPTCACDHGNVARHAAQWNVTSVPTEAVATAISKNIDTASAAVDATFD